MTRSEFDDIRAHIAAEEGDSEDLLQIARTLLDDLEQARFREATLRTRYLSLLNAARAAIVASEEDTPDSLSLLRHELARRGQLPLGDAGGLTDSTLDDMLDRLESSRRLRPGSRLRRCPSAIRRLPR
ncbi:hypothetical protein [Sphaerisporangium rufum]|nr:hypothetical protein [Sphaerisporangium rufum]